MDRKAQRTRREILAKAVDFASVAGLEGLTVAALAAAVGMSKSGLFAHFGSKEELQAAVLEAAEQRFEADVVAPAAGAAPGLERLLALVGAWLGHLENCPFRGGCFFFAAAAELDDRPGRLRDRLVEVTAAWSRRLEEAATEAMERGELARAGDAALLAFELEAFLREANARFQLHGDVSVFAKTRRAIRRTLDRDAAPAGCDLLAAWGGGGP